jgi:hypothetical protein
MNAELIKTLDSQYKDKTLHSQYKLCLAGLSQADVRRVVGVLQKRMVSRQAPSGVDWGCSYGDINSKTSDGACIYFCWESPKLFRDARQRVAYWVGTALDTKSLKGPYCCWEGFCLTAAGEASGSSPHLESTRVHTAQASGSIPHLESTRVHTAQASGSSSRQGGFEINPLENVSTKDLEELRDHLKVV